MSATPPDEEIYILPAQEPSHWSVTLLMRVTRHCEEGELDVVAKTVTFGVLLTHLRQLDQDNAVLQRSEEVLRIDTMLL